MENYIVINGRKAELTEEQLKALGIETEKKSPFDRVHNKKNNGNYYFIDIFGEITSGIDYGYLSEIRLHNVANYCTDKKLLQQQAYREILNRLLWRYSMEHDGNKIDWECNEEKYNIYYDSDLQKCRVADYMSWKTIGVVHFHTREAAENAIKEIVEPFMAEYPDFKW